MVLSEPAVGIDLGASRTAVASLTPDGPLRTLVGANPSSSTPSVVFFEPCSPLVECGPLVGAEAWEAGRDEPERMVQHGKRSMGLAEHPQRIFGQTLPPEVVQAFILQKLKCEAELIIGPVKTGVLTVPTSFGEFARRATRNAARLAGFESIALCPESTAATLNYAYQQGWLDSANAPKSRERMLVLDLGGGKFEATAIEYLHREFRTLSTAGDQQLGGLDWDRRLVEFLADAWQAEHNVDLRTDQVARQSLLRKAVQAKHALSRRDTTTIPISHLGQRTRLHLTRIQFESLTQDLTDRAFALVEHALDEALIEWHDLNRILLVGGAARMPVIRQALAKRSEVIVDDTLTTDDAIARGAAIYAAHRQDQLPSEMLIDSIIDVNPHDLSVSINGPDKRRIVIPRSTPLLTRRSVRVRTHTDGQSIAKLHLIEGGDEHNRDDSALELGTVSVELSIPLPGPPDHPGPPDRVPTGTVIGVQLGYSGDGCVHTSAELQLPGGPIEVPTKFVPARGLSDEAIEDWKRQIESRRVFESELAPAPAVAQIGQRRSTRPELLEAPPNKEPAQNKRKLRRVTFDHSTDDGGAPEVTATVKKLVRQPVPTANAPNNGGWKTRALRLSGTPPHHGGGKDE